jgi:hypothetical protein
MKRFLRSANEDEARLGEGMDVGYYGVIGSKMQATNNKE